MRGTDVGSANHALENPFPILHALPSIFHDDALAQELCAALDEVWAPSLCVLDNRDAYFDPAITPTDFLEWLASWVGFTLDERWTTEQKRALTADVVELYRWRGTVRGIRALVALYAGSDIEVVDTGGTSWSTEANSAFPGESTARVVVRLSADASTLAGRVDAIVAAAKPAHVEHLVEVGAA